jgi:hypothetical protein
MGRSGVSVSLRTGPHVGLCFCTALLRGISTSNCLRSHRRLADSEISTTDEGAASGITPAGRSNF